jgi:hypothetical protein
MLLVKWLWFVLKGEKGEVVEGDAGAGDQGNAEGAADDAGNAGDSGDGADAGNQDAGAKIEPKYGEFGDTPTVDDVYKKYNEMKGIAEKHKVLTGQAGATEKNLAMLRKTLERYGLKAEQGEDGNLSLSTVRQEPQKRQTKFAKEHESLFDARVLQAIDARIEDAFENFYESRTTKTRAEIAQQREFVNERTSSINKMFKLFPQLDGKWEGEQGKETPTNTEFDAEFHKRAEDIWKEKYHKRPDGELQGAIEAAIELGIPAKLVAGAEKTGFIKGKENKKILGTVQPKGAGAPKAGKLSQAEVLKLDPIAREKYQKEQLGLK